MPVTIRSTVSRKDVSFHGYYGCYCYLPLFAFVGSVPLWAELRTSDGDAARGAVEALQKIVPAIRKRCPKAKIIVRADSGFCREGDHGLRATVSKSGRFIGLKIGW